LDDLLTSHAALTGPADAPAPALGTGATVSDRRTERQRTLLVRTQGPIDTTGWRRHDLTLEDLVLAYLGEPEAGTLPGPGAGPGAAA
jgi:ABC-2 type transport system ATP-binding protein